MLLHLHPEMCKWWSFGSACFRHSRVSLPLIMIIILISFSFFNGVRRKNAGLVLTPLHCSSTSTCNSTPQMEGIAFGASNVQWMAWKNWRPLFRCCDALGKMTWTFMEHFSLFGDGVLLMSYLFLLTPTNNREILNLLLLRGRINRVLRCPLVSTL